ncbi:MAG: threonine synthase [Phycisphaerales bacterium]|nr:threonine synthase [Phycisphaerales bacterium]
MPTTTAALQRCTDPRCGATYPISDTLVACRSCGNLLDVHYTFAGDVRGPLGSIAHTPRFDYGNPDSSGVWRFRRLMPFFSSPEEIATIGEGRTVLQRADLLGAQLGFAASGRAGGGLYLQYEGLNPSGSFKDNGMTAAFTHARMVGAKVCACASTGNTSASMAVYAAQVGMKAVVFIGDGKIAYGKLAQALDYGALTLQVAGDFDACLARVRHIAENIPKAGVYLMNSVNPFRLEGQKSVMYRVMEGLDWKVPDWVIVPGGNLGNCSAFGKAFMELLALGIVDRVPRLAVVNATGARTLDTVYNTLGVRWNGGAYFHDGGAAKVEQEYARMDTAGERASTIATAIEINRPVNLTKALRALEVMDGRGTSAHDPSGGVVRAVDDDTIRHYKAMVGAFGFGCEPASAASVAGAHMLLQQGLIRPDQTVACILTGHALKDPDITVGYHTGLTTKAAPQPLPANRPDGAWANPPVKVADNLEAILTAMGVGPTP